MSEPLRIPSLSAKGFDARDAIDVMLEAFPDGREKLTRIDEAIGFERQAFALGGRTRDCVALFNQNVALLEAQKEEIIDACRGGVAASLKNQSLFAFGYLPPVDGASRREVIDPRFWDFLELDVASGAARGGGREFVGIRMIKLDDLTSDERRAIAEELRRRANVREREPAAEEAETTSFPGRPSTMKAIAEKMKERAARGELCGSLQAEGRYLEEWVGQHFPDRQTPKAKSIVNALRSLYRTLRSREGAEN